MAGRGSGWRQDSGGDRIPGGDAIHVGEGVQGGGGGAGAEPPAPGSPDSIPPITPRSLCLGTLEDTPLLMGSCLLRRSSSSMFMAPGLKCLKGAMRADNMLPLSGKKRRTGNALLTSSFRKTPCFPTFLSQGFGKGGRTLALAPATSFWLSSLNF